MSRPHTYFDAFARIGKADEAHPAERWSLEHLRDEMELCGIGAALVAGQGEYGNERLCKELAGEPGLYPIWTLLPGSDASGIETVAVTSAVLPDAEQARQLSGSGKPLLLSMVDFPELSDIAAFCEANPELNVLLHDIHFGYAPKLPGFLNRAPNLHAALTQGNRFIEYIVGLGFEDRILFASNAPKRSAGAMRAMIDWGAVPEEAARKIAGGNLARLLGTGLAETFMEPADSLIAAAQQGGPLPCRVLDMHAHILEEGMDGHGAEQMLKGGPSGVRELARRMGVDGVATMSWIGLMDLDTEAGNRHVREAVEHDPGFFRGLPTFDVREKPPPDIRAEMERAFGDPRMVGVKPYYTFGMPFSDPRYDPVWEFAQEHGLYIGLHPTRFVFPSAEYNTDEFDSICSRYPQLKVMAYHSGFSFAVADTVIGLCKKHPNVYAEVTFSSIPGGVVEYLVEGCGADRVLYGSDQVMRDPRPQLGWVLYSRLDEGAKRRLLGENAEPLFRR